ncbi:MAG: tetratricopeptide repeat protein, partial [Coleofasciculus sp. A1-SPW-01]|uniref:tetratricopeptide repeat protein n=1 Tax=Coleofasciculus sp. A1-SPW-01 TaxID=3070819 RepID=UPI0032FD59B8
MVKRFWRWLIRLIQPILPPFLKQKRHRRVKRQRLSDTDYQQLFGQLLTGVSQGWNSEEVFQHLGHRNDRYFKAWLREYGKRLRKLPEADHQLASQLVRLSRVGCGELGEIAAEIGRELLMKPAGKGEEVVAVEERKRVSAETSLSDSISSIENSDSEQAEVWFNRGNQQFDAGDFLGAIASFDKALQFKPDNHYAWFMRGVALADLGKYEEAIANYDKALQIQPDFHQAWYNRGVALADLGKYEEAIANYDKALQIQPDFHQAWFMRGVALADLGEYEEAIANYD